MTLTELKYVVALAREQHFGKAAAACFVSQPTLSVAIKKLEHELDVVLFQRSMQEVRLTSMGEKVLLQAQKVLGEVAQIKEITRERSNPASGTLHLGMIYRIAPYLLPRLMPHLMVAYSDVQLIVQEGLTQKLLERVKNGSLDAAIVALPIADVGLSMVDLYAEDFYVACAQHHQLARQEMIHAAELSNDALLVLGAGHCFRDQVLQTNPHIKPFSIEQDGLHKTFEGTSLETLRHMAASGIGITVLPALAVPQMIGDGLSYLPFAAPSPRRQIVLVWRKNYSREPVCHALADAVRTCKIIDAQGVFVS